MPRHTWTPLSRARLPALACPFLQGIIVLPPSPRKPLYFQLGYSYPNRRKPWQTITSRQEQHFNRVVGEVGALVSAESPYWLLQQDKRIKHSFCLSGLKSLLREPWADPQGRLEKGVLSLLSVKWPAETINSEDIRETSPGVTDCSWNRKSRIWKPTGRWAQGQREDGCGDGKEGSHGGGALSEGEQGHAPMWQRAPKSSRLRRPPAICTDG